MLATTRLASDLTNSNIHSQAQQLNYTFFNKGHFLLNYTVPPALS